MIMNHYRLYNNLNVQPLLEEINLNNDWKMSIERIYGKHHSNGRINLIQAFRNPDDPITKPLRKICTDANIPTEESTYTGVIPSKVFHKYQNASSFLGWFKDTHSAQIARVKYVKIPSKSSIVKHIDGGPYYQKHNRFHLVLQGEYQYTVNGEMREYKEGELWWFNNKELHGTYVHGNEDRVVMLFDCNCDMESIIYNLRGVYE
jgi:quercetin dioxygenase-like cupin family protein